MKLFHIVRGVFFTIINPFTIAAWYLGLHTALTENNIITDDDDRYPAQTQRVVTATISSVLLILSIIYHILIWFVFWNNEKVAKGIKIICYIFNPFISLAVMLTAVFVVGPGFGSDIVALLTAPLLFYSCIYWIWFRGKDAVDEEEDCCCDVDVDCCFCCRRDQEYNVNAEDNPSAGITFETPIGDQEDDGYFFTTRSNMEVDNPQGLQDQIEEASSSSSSSGSIIPSAPQLPSTYRNNDRSETATYDYRILQSVIHKKVKSKGSNKSNISHLVLPHEQIVSSRISKRRNALTSLRNHGSVDRKDDIFITLRSIRSTLNIDRNDDTREDDLYSPRTCPICCEDFVVGDEIVWSKNEECYHAYHLDCIVPWLEDHNECPMCRNDYIV